MKRFKIFLVNDDPFTLGMQEQYLRHQGQEDITCFNRQITVQDLVTDTPEVLFMVDNNNNTELLLQTVTAIKKFNAGIYVITITEILTNDELAALMQHGVFECMQKFEDEQAAMETTLKTIGHIRYELQKHYS